MIVFVNLNLSDGIFNIVDLASWEKRIVDQEKGEDDGVVYEEYGFSEESEGMIAHQELNLIII